MDDIAIKTLPKEFYDGFTTSSDVKPIKQFVDVEDELKSINNVTGIKFCIANDPKTVGHYVILFRCDQLHYDIIIASHPTLEQAILEIHVNTASMKEKSP